ncbi:complement C1q tumor necrosis factor-related protein 4 isoform X2 [Strongylocentrotus purpuratus]|uniref:C1q domain-containing protein n=1 Tax=Strongylocentrotus purpuratus TaxID=7668 RepID=A0A7M7RDN3_STRPU|nr:complement C1q tumor necrosis factor-related protein 4 isoform X2 [Strongylocentrotus purpuratus]|eukprot:XP_792968.1 PREDICTED: complement C1q tumor necrosis factor-related protein 4 isoform X2 [Strongylocentrotus purpuratus]
MAARGKVHFSVVFSALLEGGDEAQRIPFERALSESSESTYDTVANEFRCTIPGSYFFTFTIHPQEDKGASVSLMKNGVGQVMLSAARKKRVSNSVCSQSAILDLVEEDKVWLQLASGSEYGIRSHPGVPMVTFTGIMVN